MTYFIFLPIILTTVGEFFLKNHINFLSESVAGATTGMLHVGFIFNPVIFFALLCIVTGGILWVVAMSKFELSFLYPFLSINYLAIIVGSQVFLKEDVSIYRYVSIVLIIVGLMFISRSPNSEANKEN